MAYHHTIKLKHIGRFYLDIPHVHSTKLVFHSVQLHYRRPWWSANHYWHFYQTPQTPVSIKMQKLEKNYFWIFLNNLVYYFKVDIQWELFPGSAVLQIIIFLPRCLLEGIFDSMTWYKNKMKSNLRNNQNRYLNFHKFWNNFDIFSASVWFVRYKENMSTCWLLKENNGEKNSKLKLEEKHFFSK